MTDALDKSSSAIKFYNAEGKINGASTISSHTFTPGLVGISPSTGSSGGAKLTVTGVGFGTNSSGLNLYHVESSQNICDSVVIDSYGQFTCYSIP